MRQAYLNILFCVLMTTLFLSCEEKTTWELESSPSVMVVDALITNEFKTQHVYISSSYKELNVEPQAISGVNVALTDGLSTYPFFESAKEPGNYYSEPFRAVVGKTYKLTLSYKSFHDTATSEMIGVSPLNELKVEQQNQLYKYVDTGSSQPAMTEVYYNWSAIDTFCTHYGACTAMETYYSLETLDINEQLGPDKQVILFPKGTKLVRRKYSLSEPHQHFIRSLLMETEWRGGLFDVEQGNVLTNFRYGTRGWFATCMVLSDSLVVE